MLTVKQITSGLKSIKSAGTKYKAQVHIVAVSIIGHIFEHGDTRLADNLLDAMGKGVDRQAMIHYLEDMGCVKWSRKDARFVLNKTARAEMVFDEAYLEADDTPRWYDYAREKKALSSSFDLEARVASLLEQLKKARIDGKEVRNDGLEGFLQDALIKYHLRAETV